MQTHLGFLNGAGPSAIQLPLQNKQLASADQTTYRTMRIGFVERRSQTIVIPYVFERAAREPLPAPANNNPSTFPT